MSQSILSWLLSLLLFVLVQALAGIVSVVRMWSRITLLEAASKVQDKEILDLKVDIKATDALVTGFSAQLSNINLCLGKITGQLELLIREKHG